MNIIEAAKALEKMGGVRRQSWTKGRCLISRSLGSDKPELVYLNITGRYLIHESSITPWLSLTEDLLADDWVEIGVEELC